MTANETLYAALNVAGVNALAGSRIYPDAIPSEVPLPALSLMCVGANPLVTLDGGIAATRYTFEVWCMADTRAAAETVATAAQVALIQAKALSSGRRQEYDSDQQVHATVLTVDIWS